MMKPLSTKAPVKYTDATALRIIARIADGEPLSQICRSRGMPADRTFRRWCSEDKTLADAVAEARRVAAGKLSEDLITRAIDLDKRGREGKLKSGEIASFKEYSQTLRWFLARLDPARFGSEVSPAGRTVVIHTSLNFEERQLGDHETRYLIDMEPTADG